MRNLYPVFLCVFFSLTQLLGQTPFVQVDNGIQVQTSQSFSKENSAVLLSVDTQDQSWQWSGPSGFAAEGNSALIASLKKSNEGMYTATNNQSETVAFNVVFLNDNFAAFDNTKYVCGNQTVTLTAPLADQSYVWSTGETSESITVNTAQSASYQVTITTAFGDSDTGTIEVINVEGQTVELTVETCETYASVTGPDGLASYTWSNGDDSQSIEVHSVLFPEIQLFGIDNTGCEYNFNYTIQRNEIVAATSIYNPEYCGESAAITFQIIEPNESFFPIEVSAEFGGMPVNLGSLNEQETFMSVGSGLYENVILYGANGCETNLGSLQVDEIVGEATDLDMGEIESCGGLTSVLAPEGFDNYLWSTGDSGKSTEIDLTNLTTVTCVVIDGAGCTFNLKYTVVPLDFQVEMSVDNSKDCTSYSQLSFTTNLNDDAFYPIGVTAYKDNSYTALQSLTEDIQQLDVMPGNYTNLTLESSNGCTLNLGDFQILKTYTINEESSEEISVCQFERLTLSADEMYEEFQWTSGETTPSIEVSVTEDTYYSVEMYDEMGCGKRMTFYVSYSNNEPTMTEISLCEPQSVLLEGPEGFDTYQWNNGSNSRTLEVFADQSANYTLDMTSSSGCDQTMDFALSVFGDYGFSYSIKDPVSCDQEGQMSLSLSNATENDLPLIVNIYKDGKLYHQASMRNANASFSLTAGVYSKLELESLDACTQDFGGFEIENYQGINEELVMADKNACHGQATELNAFDGYDNYTWSNGETGQSISVIPTENETYSVEMTGQSGCGLRLLFPVSVDLSLQDVDLSVAMTNPISCDQEGQVTLMLSNATENILPLIANIYKDGELFYQASMQDDQNSFSLNAGLFDKVELQSLSGCLKEFDGFEIEGFQGTTEELSMATLQVCENQIVSLDAFGGYAAYEWSTGSTAQTISFTPESGEEYFVNMFDEDGCGLKLNFPININLEIEIQGEEVEIYCANYRSSISAEDNYDSYLWNTGATSQSILIAPNDDTQYWVDMFSSEGCPTRLYIPVTIAEPLEASFSTVAADESGIGTLDVNLSTVSQDIYPVSVLANLQGAEILIGEMFDPAAAFSLDANAYNNLRVVTTQGCTSELGDFEIGGEACQPQLVNMAESTVCGESILTLVADDGFASYAWNDGSTSQSITFQPEIGTDYYVVMTDDSDCTTRLNFPINLIPLEEEFDLFVEIFCVGSSVTLDAQSGYSSYEWSTGETSQSITVSPTESADFSVTMLDENGCGKIVYKPVAVMDGLSGTFETEDADEDGTGTLSISINSSASNIFPLSVLVNESGNEMLVGEMNSAQSTFELTANVYNNLRVVTVQGCELDLGDFEIHEETSNEPRVVTLDEQIICEGETLLLEGPADMVQHVWSTGATSQNLNITGDANVTYSVTAFDPSTNLTWIFNHPLVVNEALEANFLTVDESDGNFGGVQINLAPNTTDYPVSVFFNSSGNQLLLGEMTSNEKFFEMVPGSYTNLRVVSSQGCETALGNFEIQQEQSGEVQEITLPNVEICEGETAQLSAPTGFTNVEWSTGSNNININVSPNETTTYFVTALDPQTNTNWKVYHPIIVNEDVNASFISYDQSGTSSGGVEVNISNPGDGTYPMAVLATTNGVESIIGNLVSPSVNIELDNGVYSNLRLISSSDCEYALGDFVINPDPSSGEQTFPPMEVCLAEQLTIDAPSGYSTYMWSNGASTEDLTVLVFGASTYSVTMTDDNQSTLIHHYPVEVNLFGVNFFQQNDTDCDGQGGIELGFISEGADIFPVQVIHDTNNGPEVIANMNQSGFVDMAVGTYFNTRLVSASGCTISLADIQISNEGCGVTGGGNTSAVIAGTVWLDESIVLGMREPNEDKIEGVVIRAIDVEGDMAATATTDSDGQYSLALKADTYYLEFDIPAYLTETVANAGIDDTMDSDLDMSNGQGTTALIGVEAGQVIPNVDAGLLYGVLPITWQNVTAKNVENHNLVEWSLTEEENTSHYEIQRSVSSIQKFESIGELKANDENKVGLTYSMKDFNLTTAGIYYYRIKQYSAVGKFHYSDVVSVTVENEQIQDIVDLISVYPNPTVSFATVDLDVVEAYDSVTASIYDNTGKLIKERVISEEAVDKGVKSYVVDFSKYPDGNYTLSINMDGQEFNKQVIVLKD